jgi:hypothetical protein
MCCPSVSRLPRWGDPPTPTAPRVILDALGLFVSLAPSGTRNSTPWVTSDMILEAETVAFFDTNESIECKYFLVPYGTPQNAYCRPEFWRIRSLVENTAVGPRREVRKRPRRRGFPVWEFIPNLTTKLVNVSLSSYYFLRSEASDGVTRCGTETRMEEDPTWTGVTIRSSAQLD